MIIKKVKKVLLIMIISMLMFNFIGSNMVMGTSTTATTETPATANIVSNPSKIMQEVQMAETLGDAFLTVGDGLVGIFTYFERIKIIIIGSVLQFLGTVVGDSAGTTNSGTLTVITPEDILFNKLAITDINFFNLTSFGTGDNKQQLSGTNNPIAELKQSVANWYMTLRTIAIIILLCVLIFIGIRMVLASNPETKKNYKSMLVNWVVSLALVYLLHYIILIVININNALVDIILSVKNNAFSGYSGTFFNGYVSALIEQSFYPLATISWSSAIVYFCIVALTFIFLIMYIKRMITIAFLILISPIITITYSIDKAGDGKAQALSNWIKEFFHNVLIQPFHCLIYVAFVTIAMEMLQGEGTLASAVLVIVTMFFILQAEALIKKIFTITSESTGSALATAAVLSTAYNKLKPASKKVASNVGNAVTNAKTKASSLVASNNMTASNNMQQVDVQSMPSEELSRKMNGKAAADDYYATMEGEPPKKQNRTTTSNTGQNSKNKTMPSEELSRKMNGAEAADDYYSTMDEEPPEKPSKKTSTNTVPNKTPDTTQNNKKSSEIPDVEMPYINNNESFIKGFGKEVAHGAKHVGEAFIKGNQATSGLAGAAIGATLAGLGGADVANTMGAMAVGKSIQDYAEDKSGYTQKVNQLENCIKESRIKNDERVLASAFNNHKNGEEYNRDADIQKAREYLSMDSNKIKDIKETSERQYVQALHAMRSIYNKNYDEDPNEKVIETMGKIIDKDIKPND